MITSTVGSRQSLGLDDLGLGPGRSDIVEALHNDDDVAEVEEACAGIASSKKIFHKSVVSFLGVPLPV